MSAFERIAARYIVPASTKRGGLRLAFDIEADGLLDNATRLHCIVIADLDRDHVEACGPGQIPAALEHLARANYITGHNICGYDLPLLHKLCNWTPTSGCTILDTLVASRLIVPHVADLDDQAAAMGDPPLGELRGSCKLEAWGARLGIRKIGAGIEDWSKWTPELQARCVGDVAICKALWRLLQPDGYSRQALELEHRAAIICNRITADGVPFDVAAAKRLDERWLARRTNLEAQLQQQFPGTNFNSRAQIGALLEERGWVPESRTEKTGQPRIDDELLETIPAIYPEFTGLAEHYILGRRLGQLSNGKEAWRKHVGDDGRIHGGIVHIGTPHSRAKHLNPNLAQVPNAKKGKPFATDCRALFRADNDWVFVTCDQASLQDRGYAHYLHTFDGGAYAKAFLDGADTHWLSAIALGLIGEGTARDKSSKTHEALREGAKRFRYAFLYGCGAATAGHIVADTWRAAGQAERAPSGEAALKQAGKQALNKFEAATPGLRRLREILQTHAREHGWLPGLDGRRVPVRALYSALNFVVTSSEAIICKRWLAQVYDELQGRFRYGWDGDVVIGLWIHDELVCCCRPEIAGQVGEIMVRYAKEPAEYYGFKVPLDAAYKIGRSWAGEPLGEEDNQHAGMPENESLAPALNTADDKSKDDDDALAELLDDAGHALDDSLDDLYRDGSGGQGDGTRAATDGSLAGDHAESAAAPPWAETPEPLEERPASDNVRGSSSAAGETGQQAKPNGGGGRDQRAAGNGHGQDTGGDRFAYPHGERRTGRRVATYLYRDHLKNPHTRVEKWLPARGRAQYPQYFWVDGRWTPKKPEGWLKIPYLLPEMLEALARSRNTAVFIPEGEKDADTLAALGLVATTSSEGATPIKAKTGKWTPELNWWFFGVQQVFILEDNDEPGRAFAREKARALEGIVPDICIVSFPDVPEREDVSWWLAHGHTKEQLLARCEAALQWQADELESVRADQVVMRAIVWLWLNRFAVGKIGIIAGLPDEGKGQILCYIAARVTRGLEWPNGEGHSPQGNVIILSAEEDPSDSLAPRLAAAGADLSRIHFLKMVRDRDEKTGQQRKRMFSLVSDLEKLRRKIIEAGDLKAVLIDPVSAYLGVGKIDSYRDTDVRAVLGPLKELAEEMRVAVITVMHFNKKVDITNALLRVSNSMAFVGLPRHVYGVIADAENARKLFVRAKNNDAAESDNQTLAFHFNAREVGVDPDTGAAIRAPFIVWQPGYVDVTATEAMQATSENKSPGERDEAKQFLRDLLLASPDRRALQAEIEDIAKAEKISDKTLRRAKRDLKVRSEKDRTVKDGPWYWVLPDD
jgi:DNA polymerase-1